MPKFTCLPCHALPCNRAGDPTETLPQLVQDTGASLLVTDFTPLRLGRQWKEGVAAKLEVRDPAALWLGLGQ